MNRTLDFFAEQNGISIKDFLKQYYFSTSLFRQLKKIPNSIIVNHKEEKLFYRLCYGDLLTVIIPEEKSSNKIVPQKIQLSIVFEDEDILIVNKPANLPSQISSKNYQNTLANAAAYYYKDIDENFVYRCITRLDRNTTGLVIIAKNRYSGAAFHQMIKQREIKKTYYAIVEGTPKESGMIDSPIARCQDSIIKRCIDTKKGEPAYTRYQRLWHQNGLSLMKITLLTGRTHQIRVHMSSIGCPLVADTLYHTSSPLIARQALHCAKLEFSHPISKKAMSISCPLPEDMEKILIDFGGNSGKMAET